MCGSVGRWERALTCKRDAVGRVTMEQRQALSYRGHGNAQHAGMDVRGAGLHGARGHTLHEMCSSSKFSITQRCVCSLGRRTQRPPKANSAIGRKPE